MIKFINIDILIVWFDLLQLGHDESGIEYLNHLKKHQIGNNHMILVPDVPSGSAQIIVSANGVFFEKYRCIIILKEIC